MENKHVLRDMWIASDGYSVLEPGMMVLVRNNLTEFWNVKIFSYVNFEKDRKYFTDQGQKYCIPLKGNEYLAGTTISPKSLEDKKIPLQWGDHVRAWDSNEKMHYGIFLGYRREKSPYPFSVVCVGTFQPECFKYCERIEKLPIG